jgi:hypothetical protein
MNNEDAIRTLADCLLDMYDGRPLGSEQRRLLMYIRNEL